MKRILLLFSALMLSCIALWAHDVEIDGIYYNLDKTNKTAEVTYGGSYYDDYWYNYVGSVTIPETITYNSEIYSVTSIGSSAFRSCSRLTSVTIPNSVTSISSSAFSGCSGLTKVNYLGTVDQWAEFGFVDYSAPTYYSKDLYINNELLTDVKITTADAIQNYAFKDCKSIKSVEIGNSVTSIGKYAFSGCSELTSVIWNAKNYKDYSSSTYSPFYDICSGITSFTFGNEVEHIPAYLCYRMSKLTEITIPNSITSIGHGAFYNCGGLTKVNYLGTVDKWVEIDFDDYDSNPTYYAKDLYINNELLTDVKITTADSIKDYAFYNCQSIKSVEIGNSVTSIGSSAFSGCSGLTSVTIPNSVTSIGDYAFYNCSGLTSVIWNAKNCKDFEDYNNTPFFYIRSIITSFTFGNEVEHIPAYLCCGMSKLTEITIPNSVTSIGSNAFSGCSGLTEVTIGKSVTSIGKSAFSGCSELTSVIWNAKNYKDIFYSSDLPFYDIRSSITSFTFGNEIEHIPAHLCYGMSKLTEITIPNSITSIGHSAFSDCDKLRKVTAYPTTVPSVDKSSFAHYNAYLYVPCDVYEDYDLDDVFGNFEYIKCIAGEEDEPSSISETLADANITVSGGTISAEADFSIYNTIGQDVTAINGSLQPGVYLVSIENNIVKVMVH